MNSIDYCPNFEKGNGLIVCIGVDWQSGEVLMHCDMDETAWQKTLAEKFLYSYSTSEQKTIKQGESSGNIMKIHGIEKLACCDEDTDACVVKIEVLGTGKACHTGNKSCFFDKVV
mgnify:CR=1 FL=1